MAGERRGDVVGRIGKTRQIERLATAGKRPGCVWGERLNARKILPPGGNEGRRQRRRLERPQTKQLDRPAMAGEGRGGGGIEVGDSGEREGAGVWLKRLKRVGSRIGEDCELEPAGVAGEGCRRGGVEGGETLDDERAIVAGEQSGPGWGEERGGLRLRGEAVEAEGIGGRSEDRCGFVANSGYKGKVAAAVSEEPAREGWRGNRRQAVERERAGGGGEEVGDGGRRDRQREEVEAVAMAAEPFGDGRIERGEPIEGKGAGLADEEPGDRRGEGLIIG